MASKIRLYKKSDWQRRAALPPSKLGVEKYRDEARRDYARLIHSPSFRRLQGKTQLFPSHESDFFRNRLTHSMEVAQIAKSIAIRINSLNGAFKSSKINTDLIEFAGLAHDLGHPPFGHNGEKTLDSLMLNHGGFEGNAQTLRLLARIEKKTTLEFPAKTQSPRPIDQSGADLRLGLNPSFRALASILKYDKLIPTTAEARKKSNTDKKPAKGYYALDSQIVTKIKAQVAPGYTGSFKTIECHIMDIADDIAYSTYDIEDAFKADFLSPIKMISKDDTFKALIAKRVHENLSEKYKDHSEQDREFTASHVDEVFGELFSQILTPDAATYQRMIDGVTPEEAAYLLAAPVADRSRMLGQVGYLRTAFTSDLVGRFVRKIEVHYNSQCPAMTTVRLDIYTFKLVETLKHFVYELLIASPMLKISEKRGDEILRKLFECFMDDTDLLPLDWRELCLEVDNTDWKARVVCDYISGMTDRYSVEMYARLTSENPITIWKPH